MVLAHRNHFHFCFKQMSKVNKIYQFKIVFHTIITVLIITAVLLQLVVLLFDAAQQL